MPTGSTPSPALPDERSPSAFAGVRPWRRFHVRLAAVYGLVVILVAAAVAGALYRRWLTSETEAIRGHLGWMSVSIAIGMRQSTIADLNVAGDESGKHGRKLNDRWTRTTADVPDVVRIFVVKPGDDAQHMRIAYDFDRRRAPLPTGSIVDVTPPIAAALVAPVVEDPRTTIGGVVTGFAPVQDETGKSVGVVGVSVSTEKIAGIRRHVLVDTAALLGAAALILAAVAWRMGRTVRAPLERLVAASQRIADGHLDTRVAISRRDDEFGLLATHFDQMAVGLAEREHIRDLFGRYVSVEVARKILSDKNADRIAGEELEVTVLFSDLRGYSTISEFLNPRQVVELLNEYLGAMQSVLDGERGTVLEYLGDGILAVFGAPVAATDHAERAVRCAVAMRARLDEMNREWERTGLAKLWRDRGLPELAMRIGIHSGLVVAGNLGGRTRQKYSIIGDAVNVAARCEVLNKTTMTSILLTDAVKARLPEDLAVTVEPRGDHAVKGRVTQVTVYSV